MADDFDFEIPPVDEEKESPNRAFITAVAGIGGLLIVSLICLGLYTLVIAPRQREAREQRPTEIALTNTEIARLLTQTAIAGMSPEAAEATTTPTAASSATPTQVVVVATSTPTTTSQPTQDPLVATAQAQATLNAAQQQAPTVTSTPTALPGTGGFAEGIGIPAMLLLAAVLVTVMFVARHLRTRST